jgi:hypothetical protein
MLAEKLDCGSSDALLGAFEMQMMPAGQMLDLELGENREQVDERRPVSDRALGREKHERGCLDSAQERTRVLGRETHLRCRLETLIGVPLIAARHGTQRTARKNFGCFEADLRETLGTLRDRNASIGENAAGFRAQLTRFGQRARQIPAKWAAIAAPR